MTDRRSLKQRGEQHLIRVVKRTRQLFRGAAERRFVFIAGMQRSGTNMLMEELDRSLDTDVYHENDPRAFVKFEMRDEATIQSLADHSRARYFVIKALCELDRLPQLMARFTPAQTVWIVRAFEDVVNSATRSFGNFPQQVGRIAANRDAAQWRGRGMSAATHALVRALYRPDMNEASAAALTWYFRNVLYFEHEFATCPSVLLVRYEDLVSEPVAQFQRIFGFLDMACPSWIGDHITPRSIGKNASPQIDPGVRAACEELTGRFDRLIEVGA